MILEKTINFGAHKIYKSIDWIPWVFSYLSSRMFGCGVRRWSLSFL